MELDSIDEKDLKMGIANQVVFAKTLEKLAETNKDIIVVTSDSRGSGKLGPFGEKFPKQIVEVGIAEQSLVGVAAGLASAGKKPFAVSPACFITARALEQIKNDVAYSDNPAVMVGISAGISYGALGTTHHSLHDYAVLRAVNNISIIAPADNYETEEAVKYAVAADEPTYIRLGKKAMPFLGDAKFEFGKGRVVKEGKDLVFVACGETVYPAWQAAKKLEEETGLSATVVSMHTIKPLDTQLLKKLGAMGVPIITVEEHMVNGGLGEACASFLLQNAIHVPFRIVGIPDEYTITGSQIEIFNYYGISGEGLSKVAKEMLGL